MDARKNQQPGRPSVGPPPLTGEPLPLELVNTTYVKGGLRGRVVDALAGPGDLDRWLAAHRQQFGPAVAQALGCSEPADRVHVEAFLELRHALRELTAARTSGRTPEPEHTAVVNAAARLAAQWRELGPSFEAVLRSSESDPRRRALGEVGAAAVELFSGEQADRIRACAAPGCILYFVRTHARREWCTAGCGNRVRVARHSRRAQEGGRREPSA
ncbi:ABATE domain-containing protein [Streptomyces somaliensis]|uniref:CGNR zinc finger domain-containing protein n=1 Tax=Streptomyces somaliensis TaxID=78355 RepID=UPI0020CE8336|nr:ABATE domain-containing protein [Streptomyces somaliensis]MCP9945762.1 ABATE domain-containing protein [Streptomyces somaliensis]MCP9961061.1 ABATE domain-containing protein [Streptomyces somaliensis]MCP9973854.1 ABATE domain-containing protein [Streptomyces somaliensis]